MTKCFTENMSSSSTGSEAESWSSADEVDGDDGITDEELNMKLRKYRKQLQDSRKQLIAYEDNPSSSKKKRKIRTNNPRIRDNNKTSRNPRKRIRRDDGQSLAKEMPTSDDDSSEVTIYPILTVTNILCHGQLL